MNEEVASQNGSKGYKVGVPDESLTVSAPKAEPISELELAIEVNGGDVLHIILETFSDKPDVQNAALLQILAVDAENRRVPIPHWPSRSPRVDEYAYIIVGDEANPALTRVEINVPQNACQVRVLGHDWKSKVSTTIVGQVIIHKDQSFTPPPFVTDLGTRIPWLAENYHETIDLPAGTSQVDIDALIEGGEVDSKSPLLVRLLDENNVAVMPPGNLAQSPKLGAFEYLVAASGEQVRNKFTVNIPRRARKLVLQGVDWGERTALLTERPYIEFKENDDLERICRMLSRPEKSKLYVLDSTAPPLGDETKRLRPNNLAYEFAARDTNVLFIPFGSLQDGHGIVADNLAQVDRKFSSELIESLVDARQGMDNVYVCTSFPSLENVARAEYLRRNGWKVVYEVRDDMEEFNRVGYSKWYHPLLERKMAQEADIVITVSRALTRKMIAFGAPEAKVYTLPNGVTESTVIEGADLRSPTRLDDRNGARKVGYVGHLTASWFDWPVLLEAAGQMPEVLFEIIGHGKPNDIELPRNVAFLGAMSHAEILSFAAEWKVGIIPFKPTPLTRGVDPNKIYEYFAWGLRVVSAPMGSVEDYPSTWVYRSKSDFIDCLREALESEIDPSELSEIENFATASLWSNRAADMESLIDGINS